MRKIVQLALTCAGLGLFTGATSCGTDYDATPEIEGKDTIKNRLRGEFKAMIDGVQFIADSKVIQDYMVNDMRTISLSAVQDNYNKDPKIFSSITISISNYVGPGEYPIRFDVAGVYTNVDSSGTHSYYAQASDSSLSVINITSDADKLEGTFSFVTKSTGTGGAPIYITNGSFNVPK